MQLIKTDGRVDSQGLLALSNKGSIYNMRVYLLGHPVPVGERPPAAHP